MYLDGYWSAPGVPIPPTGNYLSAGYTIISPAARGHVRLTSASPFAIPLIDGQFLSNDFDMHVLNVGFKNLSTYINTAPAMQALNPKPYGSQVGVVTDAQIDQYNRDNA